jgi:hypothetical protein
MTNLFKSPSVPQTPEPTVMPLPDDVAAQKKKKKSLQTQQERGGRVSTMLSTSDKLGS